MPDLVKVTNMKQTNIKFILYCLCLVLAFFQISCNGKKEIPQSVSARNEENPFDQYRVSCIIPHKDDGSYWLGIVNGLMKGAQDFNIDVKMSYPSLNYDNDQMIDLVRMATSARVDAIVIPGSESEGYQDILQTAQDRGIPIVLVDTDMETFKPPLYVGSDNFHAGEIIGEKLSSYSDQKAVIGVISGGKEFYNLEQRLEGLKSAISRYPQMRIKTVDYDRFDYLLIQNSYRKYIQDQEIDTIICLEGTGAMAISALIDKKPPVNIIAFDDSKEGLEAIKTGLFDGLVVQDNYYMGYCAIIELDNLRRTGEFSSDKVITALRYLDAGPKE